MSRRIAIVSPYSYTYPGGVMRHIEAITRELLSRGHDVSVFAPYDPNDRLARVTHRGGVPQARSLPEWLVPVGRTVGFPANGAISNLAVTPYSVATLRRELRAGDFDVIHVHEPVAPMLGWDIITSVDAPLVGTFHCYSENFISNNIANVLGARRKLNHLHARIAVSEAAAWTGKRFFGGHYSVIPNGVDVPELRPERTESEELRIAFVGQTVERKGLPVLLRAFEALREHVPAKLQIIGATDAEVAPLLVEPDGVEVLGKVSDVRRAEVLAAADVLCAPSLGGESFGMVLTEAFAAGTPVIASDIAGYRDVVRDGTDGVLVPRGDAHELAEALRDLWHDGERRAAMGTAAFEHAGRYAWPRVADDVLETYDVAAEAHGRTEPTAIRRAAVKVGALPADGLPRSPARRMRTLEPKLTGGRSPAVARLRRGALGIAALLGVALALLALKRIGVDNIANSLLSSSPAWVLVSLGLMSLAMAIRAVSWHAILRAALPGTRVRLADSLQGTFIGVLMSATLPARLGEPARALIVARRIGRPRDGVPVVIGTLVSQTLLNIVALVILGAVMFSTVDVFSGHEGALLAVAIAPLAMLAVVLAAPALLRKGKPNRFKRVAAALTAARAAMHRVRHGLRVFRDPKLGSIAVATQLLAWGLQWLSCYVLLVALGLDQSAGIGAAAAVLFAVNVTAVLPATPSNLGVFQAACVAVLHGAYHVNSGDALGYGIVLQAVELTTALVMGMPALIREGVSWRDVRLRALAGSPVRLHPEPRAERRDRDLVEADV
jgi:phosphatidylinositol alpha-mannosyltransferase